MRTILFGLLALLILVSSAIPAAADFSAFPGLGAVDTFIDCLLQEFGAKLRCFEVSPPLSNGRASRFFFDLSFTMAEPERLPSLIRAFEAFAGPDLALRVRSMYVATSAESRKDGKVIVAVSLHASLIQAPGAREAWFTFPIGLVAQVLEAAKFEPAGQRRPETGEPAIWLSRLQADPRSLDIRVEGYVQDVGTIRSTFGGLLETKAAASAVVDSMTRATFANRPVFRFAGTLSAKEAIPGSRTMLDAMGRIFEAFAEDPETLAIIRLRAEKRDNASPEIPWEIVVNRLDDGQWGKIKAALSSQPLEGGWFSHISDLQKGSSSDSRQAEIWLKLGR